MFFLIVIQLQLRLHYSAIEAGVALTPVTLAHAPVSLARVRRQRIGPRTADDGRFHLAAVASRCSRDRPGASYATTSLPSC